MRSPGITRGRSPTNRSVNDPYAYDDFSRQKNTSHQPVYDEVYVEGEETRGDEIGSRECSTLKPTILYELIKARKWGAVIDRLRNDRYAAEEAGTWIVEHNTDGSVRWRLLPLHLACENQAPSELVRALVDAYSPAIIMKDSGGDLPLHLACRERASYKTICLLLEKDADASKVADEEGRLPLHLACRQGAGHDIINILLESNFRATRTPDAYQLLPLHWACAQNANVDVIESLLRAYPDAVTVSDQWGRTPHSLVLASTNPDKDLIMEHLERDGSYWTTSLLDKVKNLQTEVREKADAEVCMHEKAKSLEAKLTAVSNASTHAAQSFKQLKVELEADNAKLKDEVEKLVEKSVKTEESLQKAEEKNRKLKNQLKEMRSMASQMSEYFRLMDEQRLSILKVSGEWEDTLRAAENTLSKVI